MDFVIQMGWILLILVVGYFLLIRPMRKRAAEMQQMTSSIQPGTRVLLTSGLFGTVKHVGDKQLVIELAPDMDVTVIKQAVAKVVTPDEEEFEYEELPPAGEPVEVSTSEPSGNLRDVAAAPAPVVSVSPSEDDVASVLADDEEEVR